MGGKARRLDPKEVRIDHQFTGLIQDQLPPHHAERESGPSLDALKGDHPTALGPEGGLGHRGLSRSDVKDPPGWPAHQGRRDGIAWIKLSQPTASIPAFGDHQVKYRQPSLAIGDRIADHAGFLRHGMRRQDARDSQPAQHQPRKNHAYQETPRQQAEGPEQQVGLCIECRGQGQHRGAQVKQTARSYRVSRPGLGAAGHKWMSD